MTEAGLCCRQQNAEHITHIRHVTEKGPTLPCGRKARLQIVVPDMREYARACTCMRRRARSCASMRRYARVRACMCESARVCVSMRECAGVYAQVCASIRERALWWENATAGGRLRNISSTHNIMSYMRKRTTTYCIMHIMHCISDFTQYMLCTSESHIIDHIVT